MREVTRAHRAEAALKQDRRPRRVGPYRRNNIEPDGAPIHLNGDVLRLSGWTDEQQRENERPRIHFGQSTASSERFKADNALPVLLFRLLTKFGRDAKSRPESRGDGVQCLRVLKLTACAPTEPIACSSWDHVQVGMEDILSCGGPVRQ
jgi:hypothetical protein